MAKKELKSAPIQTDSLNKFISSLSNNIGFSLLNEKKKAFNPFSVENTEYIVQLYTLMNLYSKQKKQTIPVPDDIMVLPKAEKTVKFIFNKRRLNIDTISSIIEKEALSQIIIDEDNTIEVIKKGKK